MRMLTLRGIEALGWAASPTDRTCCAAAASALQHRQLAQHGARPLVAPQQQG